MRRFITFFLIFALQGEVCQAAPLDWCRWALNIFAGRPTREAEADVRMEDLPGRLDFLLGVLRQHPNLVTSNLSFRRNLLDTLSHVSKVQRLLGAEAASWDAKGTSILRASYVPSEDFKYNEQLLGKFLSNRAKELDGLGLLPGADLGAQLAHLKESSRKNEVFDEKGFKKKVTRLFRLLPFLFDSNGKARFSDLNDMAERERIARGIREQTPQQLSNAYGDLLKEHLAKQIESASETKGMGQLKQWFETTKNDFVAKEVKKVLTPVGEGGVAVTSRVLTAERLPNSVGLFRGCYGGDCSILSVPYYPLVKDTRSYFLRKGDDPNVQPSGYVFSTLVEVMGKKIPYILTVNGSTLTKSDVEMAIRMVAKDWGTNEVVLPDMEKNHNLVNTNDTREGMKWGGKRVGVKFSKGWLQAEKYMNKNPAKDLNGNTYTDYYHSSKVSKGFLVSLGDADKRLTEPLEQSTGDVSRYGFGKLAGTEPVLERAILASQAISDAEISTREQAAVRSHLGVSESQVAAAKPLVEMSEKRALLPSEFHAAERDLGFDIKDVLARDVATRALTLKALYEKEPELLSQHLAIGSERLVEGLAHAYRIENKDLVQELLRLPGLGARERLNVLKYLPEAYVGKPEAIASVTRTVPASHRQAILGNIAAGIGTRSVTETALGSRIIAVLEIPDTEVRTTFLAMVQEHGNRLAPWHITSALLDINGRMQSHVSYVQAERAWLKDSNVSPQAKASLVRLRRRMGQSEEDLMNQIPKNQHLQVTEFMREGTNLDVFEKLAKQKERLAAEFTVAKRESFEFEAFRFPASGGKFRLGSPTYEAGRYDSSREVVLTKPFEMQATPVTQRQWEFVMGRERQPNFKGNPDNPMEMVSWEDAVTYAQRLSELDSKYNYRLPTEAEWEVAVTQFSYEDSVRDLSQHAWTTANSSSKTHPVAELKPNANGLYDMHGNVWEWNADWYGDNPPEGVDPQGPTSGSNRVVRGGSWSLPPQFLPVNYRGHNTPDYSDSCIGFRLVRTPK